MPPSKKSTGGGFNRSRAVTLIAAYLNEHEKPSASECAQACGSTVAVVKDIAKRLGIPLAAEADVIHWREVDRFDLDQTKKNLEARIVISHQDLLLYFRQFARQRGITWRVAMTQALEGWMKANRKRPILFRNIDELDTIAALLTEPAMVQPETIHEGAQLALQRMRG